MDLYSSFAELSARECEGVDYRIVEVVRPSPVLVLAPHGGSIEPTTSEVAAAIAGPDHSLYCFEGLGDHRHHGELHITADRFDEPRARHLVARAELAVAVHGRLNRDAPETAWLGGLHEELIGRALIELASAGFQATSDIDELSGRSSANICNASRSGRDCSSNCRGTCVMRYATMPAGCSVSPQRSGRRSRTNVEISSRHTDMR